ncbi:hypothetical protein NC653_033187 [Populus alba x Populus x berolinensis]|uniref:Uncharacterized protein n=1 Tax=Populus alba x Populus x berolinensis TaxID=444605 RepID=A0AAD6LT47_9ROSI|nr:hypothetical protein NC653_033187 [Populus alba x Populus x berolinensis]
MLQIVSFGLRSPSGPGFQSDRGNGTLEAKTRWLFCTITHVTTNPQKAKMCFQCTHDDNLNTPDYDPVINILYLRRFKAV